MKQNAPDQILSGPQLFDLLLPPLTLEAGGRVEAHVVRGSLWGPRTDLVPLQARAFPLIDDPVNHGQSVVSRHAEDVAGLQEVAKSRRKVPGDLPALTSVPTILVVHALTGDMCPGGPQGWWEPVIGPGKALDTNQYRVVCFNNLGSCYGTIGPADEAGLFPTRAEDRQQLVEASGEQPSDKGAFTVDHPDLPATITSWDQARSILMALDALGIQKIHLATGGSLGGMIVLALAALAPERFERIAPIAAAEQASPWVIGWNHIGRQAITGSVGFPHDISRGLELARQLAHMTYRADAGLCNRQGRAQRSSMPHRWNPQVPYAVQTYLEYQGKKLLRRFDGRAYLTQLDAMDHHDLSRRPAKPCPDETWHLSDRRRPDSDCWGLDRIEASCLALGIEGDVLFEPGQMYRLTERLRARDRWAEYAEIKSLHGHDAFLIEWDQMEKLLERALKLPAPADRLPALSDLGGGAR